MLADLLRTLRSLALCLRHHQSDPWPYVCNTLTLLDACRLHCTCARGYENKIKLENSPIMLGIMHDAFKHLLCSNYAGIIYLDLMIAPKNLKFLFGRTKYFGGPNIPQQFFFIPHPSSPIFNIFPILVTPFFFPYLPQYFPVCLMSLSVCLSGCQSLCLSVCLSFFQSVYMSVRLYICLSVSVYMSVCLPA